MSEEKINYWLEEFSDNKYTFMSKDGLVIPIYTVFEQLKEFQQENEQLKERHYLIQGGRGNCKTLVLMSQKENDKYKSVLDEIREYIYSQMYYYDDGEDEGVDCCCDGFKLLQILDKVKE